MRNSLFVLLVGVLLGVIVYPVYADRVVAPKIIGGGTVTPNSLPWQVLLQIGSSRCGGSLISAEWVLTAAHCVESADSASITAYVGVHDKDSLTVEANSFLQSRIIKKIVMHPSYVPTTMVNDIALLQLESPVTLTTGVGVIPLADTSNPALYASGTSLQVSGWGITGSGSESQFLQSVSLKVNACAMGITRMCTGDGVLAGKNPCAGDSGGALVGEVAGVMTQAGIVSFTDDPSCSASTQAVYTKVSSFYDWIVLNGALPQSATATPHSATPTKLVATSTRTPTATYVASNTNVGSHNALALTAAGIPVISYYSDTNADLMLAVCNNTSCTAPQIRVLDQAVAVGTYPSIALTSVNAPVIAYYDAINKNLKLIVCNNTACTNPAYHVVDAVGDVGIYPTVRMTSTDLPVISYFDATDSRVKIAHCTDAACASINTVTVEAAGNAYEFGVSMALSSSDIPVISYIDQNDGALKLLVCDDISCGSPTIRTLATSAELGLLMPAALQVTSDNKPVLPFFDANVSALKLARCGDSACTTNTQSTLSGDQGFVFDMQLTTTNLPVISFYHITSATTGNLKVTICSNTSCSSKNVVTIDATGYAEDAFFDTSLALTSDNKPVMSYYDIKNRDLKLAICANPTCATVTKKVIDGRAVSVATATPSRTSTRTLTRSPTRYSNKTPSPTPFRSPSSFTKSLPLNGAKNVGTRVTISWQESKNATKYAYCIAQSPTTCTTWLDVGINRSVTISGLEKNKTYFWHVRASNAFGTTPASGAIWSFTTAQ